MDYIIGALAMAYLIDIFRDMRAAWRAANSKCYDCGPFGYCTRNLNHLDAHSNRHGSWAHPF